MSMLAIGATELRRFFRDRSNIFFSLIFPLLLVVLIGVQFGGAGSAGRVVVVGAPSALRSELVKELSRHDAKVSYASAEVARERLARGRGDVGLFIPQDAPGRFARGATVDVEVVSSTQPAAPAAIQLVRSAARAVATGRGQLDALVSLGVERSAAAGALDAARARAQPARVRVVDTTEVAEEFKGLSGFQVGAAGEVLLFVFLISLAGSTTLIQTRRLGIMRRVLASPVSGGLAIGGQVFGRFVIAAFQGAYLIAATALLFGVSWGNLGLTLVVLFPFCLVSAGAAMLIGALMDNEGAASGVGIGVGMVFAALGGCMLPLELFPDTLRTVAHITPHAWAYEALADVQRRGGGIADILPNVAVLLGMAAVLLVLGTFALRRSAERAL